MARSLAVLLLATAALAPHTSAQSAESGFGFSFTPPNGWEVMPAEVMAHIRAVQDSAIASAYNRGVFAAGAASPGGTWFDLPYLLIRLDTVGAIPRSGLRRLMGGQEWDAPPEEVDRLREAGMIRAVGGAETRWDTELQAGLGYLEMTRGDGHKINGIQFVRPYRHGLISVYYYYAPTAMTRAEAERAATQVGTSLQMEPDMAYDNRAARQAVEQSGGTSMGLWERVILAAIIGGALAGLASLFARGRAEKDANGAA